MAERAGKWSFADAGGGVVVKERDERQDAKNAKVGKTRKENWFCDFFLGVLGVLAFTHSFRPVAMFRACSIAVLVLALFSACDRKADPKLPATKPTADRVSVIKVASLVPAATDLLLGMGAADRLVAVSNFDLPDERTKHLPRAGDYQTIDWEKLAATRPEVMVVQYATDRVPPGLRQRADSLGIRVLNTRNDTLADVFETLESLAGAVGMPAADVTGEMRSRLDATKASVAGKQLVKTLIVTDDTGQYAVGPGTFLDDLLTIAGGQNVLAGTTQPYPTLDRERLLALQPEVVIVLRPAASTQETERARASMNKIPQLPAVRDERVYVLTEPWLLLPGWHVTDIAERFAAVLHGKSVQ